jgi:hypothetical protein
MLLQPIERGHDFNAAGHCGIHLDESPIDLRRTQSVSKGSVGMLDEQIVQFRMQPVSDSEHRQKTIMDGSKAPNNVVNPISAWGHLHQNLVITKAGHLLLNGHNHTLPCGYRYG